MSNSSETARLQQIGYVALVVRDYDEAIEFYQQKLDFVLIEDTVLDASKRWVLMAPRGSTGTRLLLAKAASPEQTTRIGNQTGGRSFCFCTPTTSGATTQSMSLGAWCFGENPKRRPTGPSRCLKIYTATCGTCCNSSRPGCGAVPQLLALRSGVGGKDRFNEDRAQGLAQIGLRIGLGV